MEHRPDITQILLAYGEGDRAALDQLLPIVYEQLRNVAHARLRGERPGQTLCTTGLVHEAYFKLIDLSRVHWKDRRHFFALASRLMRQIIIDCARHRKAAKRGQGKPDATLNEELWMPEEQADRLLELDEALDHLSERYPRVAEIIVHRYFSGFTNEETAELMELSVPTVERDLRFGRTWLAAFLNDRHSAGIEAGTVHA